MTSQKERMDRYLRACGGFITEPHEAILVPSIEGFSESKVKTYMRACGSMSHKKQNKKGS